MIEVLYYTLPVVGGYIIYRVCCKIGTRRKTTEVKRVNSRDSAIAYLCDAVEQEPRHSNKNVTARLPK